LLKLMKRILKFAALAVIALLTAQPALAGLLCPMGNPNGGSQAHCSGMAMSEMGMQCPMHRHAADIDCVQNCCKEGIPQGVFRLTADRKPKAGKTEYLALAPRIAADDVMAFAAPPLDRTVASGPARYVLLRVFRI
jgi:hypothetical protein